MGLKVWNTSVDIYGIILTLLNDDFKLREKVLKKVLEVYYDFLNVFNKKESNILLTFNEKNDFEIRLLKDKGVKDIEHCFLY